MAQYHFHASILKRSEGHSVVASAAYRAGERLYDSRIGYAFDYRRRHGILYTEILAPENTPDWMLDRFQLWNGVEKAEKRKDSQLARSIDISLMSELTFDQNLELIRDFVKKTWVEQGMLADIAIHTPGKESDQRNIHAHILLTMRVITADGFGNKERDWNDREEFVQWREAWADFANAALERAGFAERIDHRSLIEQGIGREPTIHVGPSGREIEHRGKTSDRAQKNRDIKATNDNIELLEKELAESEKRLAALKQQQAAERMEQIQNTVRAANLIWKKTEQRQSPAPPLQPQGPPPYPENSPLPASASGKAVSMPDDLSEAQKTEAERQIAEQKKEQARQDKIAEDEKTRLQKEVSDAESRLQQRRDAENKKVDDLAKEIRDRLAAQAEEIRQLHLRIDAMKEQQARIDAYRAEQEKIAADDRRREDRERQGKLEAQSKEGPLRDAGARYAQALGQHYDFGNPYASLAKVAMAEYAAFRKDREALDQQIAGTTDPKERQALDLRKRIEGAEYIVMTSDRIAQQSMVITGRRDSEEAVKFRKRATDCRIQALDLRQQLRQLQRGPAPEKEAERERTKVQPPAGRPQTRAAGEYDLIKKVHDAQKAKQQQRKEEQDKKKLPEQTQLEKALKKEEEKEQERARRRGDSWER
jgi:hypothetical protein